jgi:ribosome assembly protein 1
MVNKDKKASIIMSQHAASLPCTATSALYFSENTSLGGEETLKPGESVTLAAATTLQYLHPRCCCCAVSCCGVQVSPPLVAFKESVLSGSEGVEGVTVKPAKVVEAGTPSGVCVVRVKAHALPNSTAALLDEHANLIKDLLQQQHRKQEDRVQRQQQQQQSSGGGVQQQQDSSSKPRRSLDVGDRSKEAHKLCEAYSTSTQELASTNKQLTHLLQRAWLLGPRNVGPNIALCSPCRATSSSSSSSSSSSLFEVPASQVVRASSRHGPLSKLTGAAAVEQPPIKHPHHHGEHSEAANGTAAAGHETGQAAAHGAEAAAAADSAQQHQHDLNVPFGWPAAAAMLSGQALPGPGADAAAKAAAAAGLSDLWPHITSSVESGVTAGFQLASAAGPLCDEALWGVVFEVEVRLVLPLPGTGLDLAEGVYGPFSGQVRAEGISTELGESSSIATAVL